jgi:hypothetical protein
MTGHLLRQRPLQLSLGHLGQQPVRAEQLHALGPERAGAFPAIGLYIRVGAGRLQESERERSFDREPTHWAGEMMWD